MLNTAFGIDGLNDCLKVIQQLRRTAPEQFMSLCCGNTKSLINSAMESTVITAIVNAL